MAFHELLKNGGWRRLTSPEQFGNIESEISSAMRWHGKDKKLFDGAVDRTLELFDMTLDDSR